MIISKFCFFFIQDEKSKTFTCLNVLCAGTVIFIYCDLQVDRIGDFQNNTSQKKKKLGRV